MRMNAMYLSLICVFALCADVVLANDFDSVEEDRVLSELRSGNVAKDLDAGVVFFITDTDGRLTLPQAYDEAVVDFVRIIGNDDKWSVNLTLRRAISGLCRKITTSSIANNLYIQEVYAMLASTAEKFPMNERYRLLSFMNRLDAFRQKKIDADDKAQQKADADAAKEAEKQKIADDKASAAMSAVAAKTEATEKEKKPRTSRVKTARQKTLTSKDSNSDDAELPDEQKSVTPRKPRGRTRKAGDAAAETPGGETALEPESRQDRFDRPHAVLISGSENLSVSGDIGSGTQNRVAQETSPN